MNENMNYDCDVRRLQDDKYLTFDYSIEHLTSPSNLYISIKNEDGEESHRAKVVNYLYGRIKVGTDNYFAELMGFIEPNNPKILTYHFVFIDPNFYDKYELIATYSAINDSENYEFL